MLASRLMLKTEIQSNGTCRGPCHRMHLEGLGISVQKTDIIATTMSRDDADLV